MANERGTRDPVGGGAGFQILLLSIVDLKGRFYEGM